MQCTRQVRTRPGQIRYPCRLHSRWALRREYREVRSIKHIKHIKHTSPGRSACSLLVVGRGCPAEALLWVGIPEIIIASFEWGASF